VTTERRPGIFRPLGGTHATTGKPGPPAAQLSTSTRAQGAHFACAAALALPTYGACEGASWHVWPRPAGTGGFGYDPILQPEGRRDVRGDVAAEKNRSVIAGSFRRWFRWSGALGK